MLTQKISTPSDLSDAELIATLKRANKQYRAGQAEISDAEYDALIAVLSSREPNHPFFDKPEPEPLFGKGKITHSEPMLSLAKAYSEAEVHKFIERVQLAAQKVGYLQNIEFIITPKLDGLAGRYENGVLATRGDGVTGNNITHIFDIGVLNFHTDNEPTVGEIVMSKIFADRSGIEPDRARNVVAGIASADEVKNKTALSALETGGVHFVPFNSLQDETVSGLKWVDELGQIESRLQADCPYPTDGIVITVADNDLKEAMGANSRQPRYAIAKKSQGQSIEANVTDVTFQIGRSGRLTPVLELEPVQVGGCQVSRVTAHHAGWLAANCAGQGSKVSIVRSGEVIPHVVGVVSPSEVVLPKSCPDCGSETKRENDFLYCSNTVDCPSQLKAKLVYFFKTIGVDLFGPAACQKLVDAGLDSVVKVYKADLTHFLAAGFGEKGANNLIDQLNNSLINPLDDFKLIAALGIHLLGRGDSRRVLNHYHIDTLVDRSVDELVLVDGIGIATASSLVDEMSMRTSEIVDILGLGFKVVHRLDLLQASNDSASSLAGKKLVFTGTLSLKRDQMRSEAEGLGITTQSSISAKTDYLVAGGGCGASKIAKAEKLGVKIISEEIYRSLL